MEVRCPTAVLAALAFVASPAMPSGPNPMDRATVVRALHLPKPRPVLTREELTSGDLALIHGDPARKEIALTFDDGPHGTKTLALLAELRRLHIPATFFVVGKMAAKQQGILRAISESGNLVENHSFDHPCLDAMSYEQVKAEYAKCSAVIAAATGRWPAYCRPPGGDFDPCVLRASSDLGLTTVLWTDDPGDFLKIPAQRIAASVLRSARPGGIILLHDGMPETIAALPTIVETLRAKGYSFVTVDGLHREHAGAIARRQVSSRAAR